MPRVCAESSPQRQASSKLEPSQGQAWGLGGGAVAAALVGLMKRAARPRHLTATGSLAAGLPAQLGQATARVRGRGQLRQVARRAHCRARPRRLCHPAASRYCRRAPPWCRVELRTSVRYRWIWCCFNLGVKKVTFHYTILPNSAAESESAAESAATGCGGSAAHGAALLPLRAAPLAAPAAPPDARQATPQGGGAEAADRGSAGRGSVDRGSVDRGSADRAGSVGAASVLSRRRWREKGEGSCAV